MRASYGSTPAQRVTAAILDQIKAGVRPWLIPWTGGTTFLPRRANGVPYRGINRLSLRGAGAMRMYESPYWLSFNAALAAGGQVRRGETGSLILFGGRSSPRGVPASSSFPGGDGDIFDDGDAKRKTGGGYFLKCYTVFNASQCDGLPERYFPEPPPPPRPANERLDEFMAFARTLGADIRFGGLQAFYSPGEDFIALPDRARFRDDGELVATAAHELVHMTGSKSRLGRDFGRMGSKARAAEELVAELGASMLASVWGGVVEHYDMANHAAYISSWMELLGADERALVTISAKAEAAVMWLLEKGGRPDLIDALTGCDTDPSSSSATNHPDEAVERVRELEEAA